MWATVPLLLVLMPSEKAVKGLNSEVITERGRSWRKRLLGGEVSGAGEQLWSSPSKTGIYAGTDIGDEGRLKLKNSSRAQSKSSETMGAGILESIVIEANDRSGKMTASSSSLEEFVFKGLRRSLERVLNGYFIVIPEIVRSATDHIFNRPGPL